MESSDMKNIVILKNLPSNMVDEAIIILKQKKKVKQKELVEKRFNNNEYKLVHQKSKEYILKEAEMLVNEYINKIEKKYDNKRIENNMNYKYQRLKKYSIALTIILLFSIIFNFI